MMASVCTGEGSAGTEDGAVANLNYLLVVYKMSRHIPLIAHFKRSFNHPPSELPPYAHRRRTSVASTRRPSALLPIQALPQLFLLFDYNTPHSKHSKHQRMRCVRSTPGVF